MNRSLRTLVLGLMTFATLALATGSAEATMTYAANFDSDLEGWQEGGDGTVWISSGGQDGGYVSGYRASGGCPYLTPPTTSILYGDLATNFGSNVISVSYYLKNLGGTPNDGGKLYMFADADSDGSWDTLWGWTTQKMQNR